MLSTLRDSTLLGISALEWLKGAAIGLGVLAGLWGLRTLMVNRLQGASKTETRIDDFFLLLARKTSRIYMFAMGVAATGAYLNTRADLPSWLRIFTISALCLQLLWWSNAAVDFWLDNMSHSGDAEGTSQRGTSLAVIGILVRAAIFVIVFVLALDNFGVNVTALVTGLGITGIAVALAVQNILGDLLAALAIAFDKPFAVGDEIKVVDVTGRVEQVGLKTTRLRLATGEEVSIANAEVMRNRLTNVSRTHTRMIALTVGVSARDATGASLLALASESEAAASGVAEVQSAKARVQGIVDGRAQITVESVLYRPGDAGMARQKLIAALTDVASTDGRLVLGVN